MVSGGDIEVSVLVLSYNQAATLGRALDSIVSQKTDFRFEILVADDCSTDGTGDVARQYADLYPELIRVLPRRHNLGLVRNYFDTFSHARGRFIADCAGDDAWSGTDRLQALHDVIAADNDMTLVHADWCKRDVRSGRCELSDPDGLNRGLRQPVTDGRRLMPSVLGRRQPLVIHLSAALYRASVLRDAIAVDPDNIIVPEGGCEDLPVIMAMLDRGRIGFVDRVVLDYTVSEGTVSNPPSADRQIAYVDRMVGLTAIMSRRYGITGPEIDSYIRRQIDFVAGLARIHHRRDWARMASRMSRDSGVAMSLRAKINSLIARLLPTR